LQGNVGTDRDPTTATSDVPTQSTENAFGAKNSTYVWQIDHILPYLYTVYMKNAFRKVTVNIPVEILEQATQMTGQGITSTVIAGLRELEKRAKRSALRNLKGKVRFKLDLDTSRQ